MGINERIQSLGFQLPPTPTPAGAYVPGVIAGSLCFVSGQTGTIDGRLVYSGKLGAGVTIEDGYRSAQIAVLNCLAEAEAVMGDLESIKRIVKVTGFVASAPGFDQQPKVVNGASDLLVQLFGDRGRHARSAVGVAELPFGAPVEVELIVEFA
ncbi:MAG: RidA family protein [Clostridia bacterium]|nr:RidA family protein [Clostridia bacterium]